MQGTGLREEGKASAEVVSQASTTGTSPSSASKLLVPSNPETKYLTVCAVELTNKPLFPGGLMAVEIQDPPLVAELLSLKDSGAQVYVGAFWSGKGAARGDVRDGVEFAAASALPDSDADGGESSLLDSGSEGEEAEGGEAVDESPHGVHRAGLEHRVGRLSELGTFAQVHAIVPHDDHGSAQVLLVGHRRLRRLEEVQRNPYKVAVRHLKDDHSTAGEDAEDHLKATGMEIVSSMKELTRLHPLYEQQLKGFIAITGGDLSQTTRLADMGASLTTAEASELQEVLEELNVSRRAAHVLSLLKRELELCRLQRRIGKKVEEKIAKDQRRYFLTEQLKSIQRELGIVKDEKATIIHTFVKAFEPFKPHAPPAFVKVVEEELQKLSVLDPGAGEYNTTRNYLSWLTCIPWGTYSQDQFDIHGAKTFLDEDHYGMTDVKDRILEFIAVTDLIGHTHGKILCLVGPPGVGKTSIGKSIAKALGREYYRFSVGGLSDVAEIKGHRRTYVGAMPGKLVQCLKSTGVSNPLVLIDEIDKLGRGYQGDPASALLETLDPEQNAGFMDHYLDTPVDLSNVLFMCTANVLDTIPGPLLDRMEVIRLSGYITHEKVAIARRYLEPQAMQASGVPRGAADVADDALDMLIDDYCRESGVRNLKNQLDKIYRKVAYKLVQSGVSGESLGRKRSTALPAATDVSSDSEEAVADDAGSGGRHAEAAPALEAPSGTPEDASSSGEAQEGGAGEGEVPYTGEVIRIGTTDLKEYLGAAPFTSDKMYAETPVGVTTGLAWTSMGGSTLYVEAAVKETGEGKGGLQTTGQLGDVMKESAAIAYTFARAFHAQLHPDSDWFSSRSVHMHVPAGATPKDGPSAGGTIITSLLSLALDRPVLPNLAMTGEVSLTGKILPIGGVKEKTLAARRSGVEHLVFPEGNRRDWEELSEEVREGFEPHFVSDYSQIYDVAFGTRPS